AARAAHRPRRRHADDAVTRLKSTHLFRSFPRKRESRGRGPQPWVPATGTPRRERRGVPLAGTSGCCRDYAQWHAHYPACSLSIWASTAGQITRAGDRLGRHRLRDAREVGRREPHLERAERFAELIAAARADQRHDVLAARAHPGEGELRGRGVFLARDGAERAHERHVARKVLG